MKDDVLESFIRQHIEAHANLPVVSFAWQGGEPTLRGVDFFERVVALQQQHADGRTVENAIQTNGILVDERWSNDGSRDLNYLCAAYKRFFRHIDEPMKFMANELAHRRPPANIMGWAAARDKEVALKAAGRNDPCPCGSGKKFKQCCGRTGAHNGPCQTRSRHGGH